VSGSRARSSRRRTPGRERRYEQRRQIGADLDRNGVDSDESQRQLRAPHGVALDPLARLDRRRFQPFAMRLRGIGYGERAAAEREKERPGERRHEREHDEQRAGAA